MEVNTFRGDLTDSFAKKEALYPTAERMLESNKAEQWGMWGDLVAKFAWLAKIVHLNAAIKAIKRAEGYGTAEEAFMWRLPDHCILWRGANCTVQLCRSFASIIVTAA